MTIMRVRKSPSASLTPSTRLTTSGRQYSEHGMINPAVYHASTVLFPTLDALKARTQPYTYARRGTPTARALEDAICTLEGGAVCRLFPSGAAAVAGALLSFLSAGDHLLMVDCVYGHTRQFVTHFLTRFGIETTFFDPLTGTEIAALMRSNTRMVYLESPGSNTMEVQDIPAIAEIAHARGALVAVDNTWSAGHYLKVFAHGGDISVQSVTKYISGHSDLLMGAVTVSPEHSRALLEGTDDMGLCAGPDDIYLALRGLRSLAVRLEKHMANALAVAGWLQEQPEVETVLYPALPGDRGHALWKRDFTGASGLFSIVLKPVDEKALAAMLDHMTLFHMGYSWGGYESLIVPFNPESQNRTKTRSYDGQILRLHIGLESPDDLIADLKDGLTRLRRAT